jgi:NAD(P)-dependent dehydrogenase (short-subunit alcohol dehydrogenase family)
LEREVVIVAGGTAGMGKAVALRLAALGHSVLVVGRSLDRVSETVAELTAAGAHDASGYAGNVAEDGTAEAYTAACLERHGPVTALLVAAGTEGPMGPVESLMPRSFDDVVAVNLRGTFLALRAVVPLMKHAGRGRIVTVSSQAGLRGVAALSAYSASKHAVIGLSRSVALEVAGDGIAVNVVCPGPTDTAMIARVERAVTAAGGEAAAIAGQIPTGRYGAPDEVAQTITWLLTASPAQLTGAVVPVDGGLTAL